METTVGKVLGFVCVSRPINTARELFKQLKELHVVGYDTDFLKTYQKIYTLKLCITKVRLPRLGSNHANVD